MNRTKVSSSLRLAVVVAFVVAPLGCGHTDEELAAKQLEIEKLTFDLHSAQRQVADDVAKYSEAQGQIDSMKVTVQDVNQSHQQARQALEESKQRADQVQALKRRLTRCSRAP
jgi:chemotaxis protein MotB